MSDRILSVESGRIIFRNFAGKGSTFNPEGRRTFGLIIDNVNMAEDLKAEGWNVKALQPRDPEDDVTYFIQVRVNFGNISPKIFMITDGHKTQLDEDTVSALDFAEIKNVDVVVRPYNWEVNGKKGVTAYLKTMYVTIQEDEFAKKYSDSEMEEELPWD